MSDDPIRTRLAQLAQVLAEIANEQSPTAASQDHSLRVSQAALFVVIQFLDGLQSFQADEPGQGPTRPLWDLLLAVQAIGEGTAHPLLSPRKTGKRSKTVEQQALVAWASIALDCLIAEGVSLDQASSQVAAELGQVRLSHGATVKRVTGRTVQTWRYKLREGGDTAEMLALVPWRKYLDAKEKGLARPETMTTWAFGMLRSLLRNRLILQLSSPHGVIRAKCQCMAGLGGADPVGPGRPGGMSGAISTTSGAGGR